MFQLAASSGRCCKSPFGFIGRARQVQKGCQRNKCHPLLLPHFGHEWTASFGGSIVADSECSGGSCNLAQLICFQTCCLKHGSHCMGFRNAQTLQQRVEGSAHSPRCTVASEPNTSTRPGCRPSIHMISSSSKVTAVKVAAVQHS